jgi:hypothetical protein
MIIKANYPMLHARIRALERIPGICPGMFVRGIAHAVKHNRRDVLECVGMQDKVICLYAGRAVTGQVFRAAVDATTGNVITVMAYNQFKYARKKRRCKRKSKQ